jgi:phospho-N-acetylmuramoyl-pentapeptide-transferase
VLLPVFFLVVPFFATLWLVIGCLVLAMLTGFMDDRSTVPWGEYMKGSLDLVVAILAGWALCRGEPATVWLPVIKHSLVLPAWLYIAVAAVVLWLTMNATNCSDGVDGLAGSLTLLSLFYLGIFLYVVIGHVEAANYLLVPHNPEGARWAILLLVSAGGLAGYLWYNAEPSKVLMGDAGSRFLGLLVGVAVLAAGNPFLIIVVAPVVLANGGTGLVKVALLRMFKQLGMNIEPPAVGAAAGESLKRRQQEMIIRLLHRVRFPLHDHCRKVLGWSNAQVLVRFVLLQAFLTPILLVILIKVR